MAQAAVSPRHQPEPDRDHWPDDAKEEWDKLNDLNDALVRVNNEMNRVIQSLRALLDLETDRGRGGGS